MHTDRTADAFAERGDDRVVPRGVHPVVGDPGTYHPKDQSGFQASRAPCANDRPDDWPSAFPDGFAEGLDEPGGLLVGDGGSGGGVGELDGVAGGGGGAVGELDGGGGDGAWVCVGGAWVGPLSLPSPLPLSSPLSGAWGAWACWPRWGSAPA